MAQNDSLKRYLDAGVAFTQMTRDRAEAIVQELVKAGEVRRKEAEKQIEDLLERSRKNTEELVGIVRREVADQLRNLGLADLAKRAGLPGPKAKPSPKKNAAKNPPAPKKSAPKKSAAKKAPAKKAAPKKATTRKVATKKAAPKKAAAKKSG